MVQETNPLPDGTWPASLKPVNNDEQMTRRNGSYMHCLGACLAGNRPMSEETCKRLSRIKAPPQMKSDLDWIRKLLSKKMQETVRD